MKYYWKACLYCGKQFKGHFGQLACRKCRKLREV